MTKVCVGLALRMQVFGEHLPTVSLPQLVMDPSGALSAHLFSTVNIRFPFYFVLCFPSLIFVIVMGADLFYVALYYADSYSTIKNWNVCVFVCVCS